MGYGRALTSVATPEVSYVITVWDGAAHQYDGKRDPAELCEQNKAGRCGTTRSANMPGPTCRPAPKTFRLILNCSHNLDHLNVYVTP